MATPRVPTTDELKVSVSVILERIDELNRKMDGLAEELRTFHNDHERRIRDLEIRVSTLATRIGIVGMIATTLAALAAAVGVLLR